MEALGYIFTSLFVIAVIGFLGFPKSSKLYKYCKNVLLTYDQGFNAIVLLGDPDETVSSRAYKRKLQGSKPWGLLVKLLELIDPGHGEASVEWDEGTKRADVPLKTNTINKEDK